MRRIWVLAALATILVAYGWLRAIPSDASRPDRTAVRDALAGCVDDSRPSDDGTSWRPGQTSSSAIIASVWRAHEFHAYLATVPVFSDSGVARLFPSLVADARRPHAPPHFLNDSLLI